MEEEYNDDQIGQLEEEEVDAEDQINQNQLEDAVDEFIDDKKRWFRKLHKTFGEQGVECGVPME